MNSESGFELYWKLFKPRWAKRNKTKIKFLKIKQNKEIKNFDSCCLKENNYLKQKLLNYSDEHKQLLLNQNITQYTVEANYLNFIKEFFFEFRHEQKSDLKENFVVWKLNFSVEKEKMDNIHLKIPQQSTQTNSKK